MLSQYEAAHPLAHFTANVQRIKRDLQIEQTFPTMSGERLIEYFIRQIFAVNAQVDMQKKKFESRYTIPDYFTFKLHILNVNSS